MTDAEKLQLIREIVKEAISSFKYDDEKHFLLGTLCAVGNIVSFSEQKETPEVKSAEAELR